ncbi:hypothetical protein E4T42_06719 [Aureobasidium subglaciale]|nr:hypothetical protein E4T42_06719 [Aureobasidium subglaciale]
MKVPAASVAATRNLIVPSCPSIDISKVSHALCFKTNKTTVISFFQLLRSTKMGDTSMMTPPSYRLSLRRCSARYSLGVISRQHLWKARVRLQFPYLNPPCPATQAAQKIQPAINNINIARFFFQFVIPSSNLSLLITSAMTSAYSFADGGEIPRGDPNRDARPANVSRPVEGFTGHSQQDTQAKDASSQLNTRATIPTSDLSQKFKPRFEDGSEIKLEYMPSLARRADQDLLAYLQKRKISLHFLNDIDNFLKGHPELLKACPSWCLSLNDLPPLQAYLFFVKGYLRPARYEDGALPGPEDEQIPTRPISLEHHSHDPELHEHVTDIGQCLELLGGLDQVIWLLTQAYHSGQQLDERQIVLLIMATYAQPVDALKYYEYCYMASFHPDSHLPHIESVPKRLSASRPAPQSQAATKPSIRLKTTRAKKRQQKRSSKYDHDQRRRGPPKSRSRQQPIIDQPYGLKASGVELMKSHRRTRIAMARAADRGHDAIPVLIDCFAETVHHRSAKRPSREEMIRMCEVAYEVMEREYLTGGGRDIVDLVMMLAPQARYSNVPSHFHPYVNKPTGAYYGVRSRYVRSATNQLRALYDLEVRKGHDPLFVREVKKAEYRLTDLIGWYGRMDGSMSKEEYNFLRSKFPHRRFNDDREYDEINPGRYDVLLFLERWL